MSIASLIPDIIITSLETITAFGISDGNYRWTLDELQNATISNTEDTTDITGKQGRLLSSIKRNKAATISGTNGVLSNGLMESQTGNMFTNGNVEIVWTDNLVVNSDTASTTYKAVGTTGAEIISLFVKDNNMVATTELTQAATAAAGKFAYNPTNKALTFNDGEIEDGTPIVVIYKRKIAAPSLANRTDQYAEKVQIYLDAIGEDKCGNVYHVQFHLPKVEFNGNFDLEFGENQATHAFEGRVMAGACTADGAMWTYTVFAGNTADAA